MRLLLPLLLLALPGLAQAKDLRNRVGLGFNQLVGDVSSISVRYGAPTPDPAINLQVEVDAGLSSYQSASTDWYAGGRLLYGVVAEDNMNLWVAGGAGLMGGTPGSWLRVRPAMGADVFLFGLENLGLTVEWGVNVDMGDQTGIATTAGVGVGAHYWF